MSELGNILASQGDEVSEEDDGVQKDEIQKIIISCKRENENKLAKSQVEKLNTSIDRELFKPNDDFLMSSSKKKPFEYHERPSSSKNDIYGGILDSG